MLRYFNEYNHFGSLTVNECVAVMCHSNIPIVISQILLFLLYSFVLQSFFGDIWGKPAKLSYLGHTNNTGEFTVDVLFILFFWLTLTALYYGTSTHTVICASFSKDLTLLSQMLHSNNPFIGLSYCMCAVQGQTGSSGLKGIWPFKTQHRELQRCSGRQQKAPAVTWNGIPNCFRNTVFTFLCNCKG